MYLIMLVPDCILTVYLGDSLSIKFLNKISFTYQKKNIYINDNIENMRKIDHTSDRLSFTENFTGKLHFKPYSLGLVTN